MENLNPENELTKAIYSQNILRIVLIFSFAIIIIILSFFFYYYMPLDQKNKELETQVKNLTSEKQTLEIMIQKNTNR